MVGGVDQMEKTGNTKCLFILSRSSLNWSGRNLTYTNAKLYKG